MLAVILDIVGEFVLEMIFGLAAEALGGLIDDGMRSAVRSAMGLILAAAAAGVAAGLLARMAFPPQTHRDASTVRGGESVLAPLATGAVMQLLGTRLRRLERQATSLATFWGGALFAFSMALVRWWLVGMAQELLASRRRNS